MLSEKRFVQGLLRALEIAEGKDAGYVRSACVSMLTYCREFTISSLQSILATVKANLVTAKGALTTGKTSPGSRIPSPANESSSAANLSTILVDLANLRAVASIASLSSLRRYIIGNGSTLLMILTDFAKCLPKAHAVLNSRQENQQILPALEESCLVMIEIISQVSTVLNSITKLTSLLDRF